MTQKRILLCLAHMSGHEMKFIQEAFDTNWVVPLGPNVNGFEKDLEKYMGQSKRVVALSAGTAAVHLALIACGVGPGDEVIVQTFTFCASSHPITYLGATPVFVDSESETWNMSPELLEETIKDRIAKTGRKPKAIIPVYLYGMPGKIAELLDVASRYEIPVIEDAAEGFGSRYNGQMVGTFGLFGVLSFNGNKMITTSGGGALVCPDEESYNRIMYFATQARESYPYYQHTEIGYNYRMSNICAGIGRGFFQTAMQFASTGIQMPTSIEKLGSHFVAWKIINRAQTHKNQVIVSVVFTQRNRKLQPLYTQWFVDKSLQITFHKMESFHVTTAHCEVGGMIFIKYTQAFAHQKAT